MIHASMPIYVNLNWWFTVCFCEFYRFANTSFIPCENDDRKNTVCEKVKHNWSKKTINLLINLFAAVFLFQINDCYLIGFYLNFYRLFQLLYWMKQTRLNTRLNVNVEKLMSFLLDRIGIQMCGAYSGDRLAFVPIWMNERGTRECGGSMCARKIKKEWERMDKREKIDGRERDRAKEWAIEWASEWTSVSEGGTE